VMSTRTSSAEYQHDACLMTFAMRLYNVAMQCP